MVAMIQNMLLMGKCVVLKEIYKLELEGFVTHSLFVHSSDKIQHPLLWCHAKEQN